MLHIRLDLTRLTLLGGGSGPSALVPGLMVTLPSASAVKVVIGTHDGGSSSGKLRKIFGGPAVGDLRKNLSAACGPAVAEVFETRFGANVKPSDIERLTARLFASIARRDPDMHDLPALRKRLGEVLLVLERSSSPALGGLAGHVYGNLLLTAMRLHFDGDIMRAARAANEWFGAVVDVIPVSGQEHDLVMNDGRVEVWGEGRIDGHRVYDPLVTKVWLDPEPLAAQPARSAIAEATTIIIGPGSVFTSLMPLLYVKGVAEAIREQGQKGGKLLYVANLVEERHATRGLTVADQLRMMEARIGRRFDMVAYNDRTAGFPQSSFPQLLGEANIAQETLIAKADLADDNRPETNPNDAIAHLRSMVNHDGKKLGGLLRSYAAAGPAASRSVIAAVKR